MWSLLQLLLAATALVACIAMPSSAQEAADAMPSCAAKLAPCGSFLNSTTKPPASCCGPLRQAAANEKACMCAILMNKAVLLEFHVAPEQGILLANRCGVATGAASCRKSTVASAGATAGTAASSASTGTAVSKVPAKPTASGGATHRLNLIGVSCLIGVNFIWSMIMA